MDKSIKYIQKHCTCEGRKIFYKYYQVKAPTVIFEAGLEESNETWNYVQNQISEVASTFSYDRAGLGNSDEMHISRTCQDIVNDLAYMLSILLIKPPYILVGHSFGGLVVRLFANMYPDLIKGIVLVDAAAENKEIYYEKILTGEQSIQNREYLNKPMLNSEKINKIESYNQIASNKDLYNIPLTVIIRGVPDNYDLSLPNDKILEIDQKLQLNFKKLSTRSKVIIAQNSTHYIQYDEPEIIIQEVKKFLSDTY